MVENWYYNLIRNLLKQIIVRYLTRDPTKVFNTPNQEIQLCGEGYRHRSHAVLVALQQIMLQFIP